MTFVKLGTIISLSVFIPLTVAFRLYFPNDDGRSYIFFCLIPSMIGILCAALAEPIALLRVAGARRAAARGAVVLMNFAFFTFVVYGSVLNFVI